MNNQGYGRFNGPAKHIPQKPKGKVRLFFELWLANFWDLIPLNVVYCMLSLMLLPYGFVSVGLTNVTRNLARDKHSFGISDFFDTAKKNWKQALAAGLINILVTAVLLFGGYFYFCGDGWFAITGLAVTIVAFAVFSIMKYYLWVIMITFKLPLKNIYKNSFFFVFLNLKNNLLIGIISVAYYALLVIVLMMLPYPLTITLEFLVTIMVFPGFKQLLVQYLVFPSVKQYIIDPYYAEHPEEDVERRKDLHV